jgi:hypothetical protein
MATLELLSENKAAPLAKRVAHRFEQSMRVPDWQSGMSHPLVARRGSPPLSFEHA